MHFLIRVRNSAGILTKIPLPEGEFDLTFQIYLTRKQNKKTKALMKENPGIYRFLPSQHPFPYLSNDAPDFYPITLRFVRFHISDDSMETLVTNLDEDASVIRSEEVKSWISGSRISTRKTGQRLISEANIPIKILRFLKNGYDGSETYWQTVVLFLKPALTQAV